MNWFAINKFKLDNVLIEKVWKKYHIRLRLLARTYAQLR